MKIKTSRRNDADFVAWGPDEKGIFSVKSAYVLGMNTKKERGTREQQAADRMGPIKNGSLSGKTQHPLKSKPLSGNWLVMV
jgi:hypothetical protein